MDVENTDLERRVLAHEQILQVLIAHMAEAEPRFLDRLQQIFTKHHTLGANEQDYTDTAAYAEQLVPSRFVLEFVWHAPVRRGYRIRQRGQSGCPNEVLGKGLASVDCPHRHPTGGELARIGSRWPTPNWQTSRYVD